MGVFAVELTAALPVVGAEDRSRRRQASPLYMLSMHGDSRGSGTGAEGASGRFGLTPARCSGWRRRGGRGRGRGSRSRHRRGLIGASLDGRARQARASCEEIARTAGRFEALLQA